MYFTGAASTSSWRETFLRGLRFRVVVARGLPLVPARGRLELPRLRQPENACGSSQEVTNASACAALYEPTQVHFAFAGGDGLSVSWTTRGNATQRAAYGAAGAELDAVVDATTVSYLESFQHTAVVTRLAPSTTYEVGVGAEKAWSDVFTITTRGRGPRRARARGRLRRLRPAPVRRRGHDGRPRRRRGHRRLLLAPGDAGYADALLHEPLTWAYEAAWDEYMDQACGAFASRAPYMVLPGNHEAECHSPACVAKYASRALKLSNFSAYNARFRMPSSESGGSANMWYSFDVGPLHVVALSTESDFPGAPDVCHADLKSVNRSATPWVVVGGHRPLHSVKDLDADEPAGTQASLVAALSGLFATYDVDLYVSGHEHAYERNGPFNGTTHVVTGAGGEDEGHSDYSAAQDPPWNVLWDNKTYGDAMLEATGDELSFTQVDAATGGTLDAFVLRK
ncbi:acid phosphatase [Aureococcus anophagefferens]|nr:acid phosphatase [Aureococcus anophagefferens]